MNWSPALFQNSTDNLALRPPLAIRARIKRPMTGLGAPRLRVHRFGRFDLGHLAPAAPLPPYWAPNSSSGRLEGAHLHLPDLPGPDPSLDLPGRVVPVPADRGEFWVFDAHPKGGGVAFFAHVGGFIVGPLAARLLAGRDGPRPGGAMALHGVAPATEVRTGSASGTVNTETNDQY